MALNFLLWLCSFRWPEGTMLQLLDLPTMAAYRFAENNGILWTISPGLDMRFIVVSSAIWFLISFVLAAAVLWLRARKWS